MLKRRKQTGSFMILNIFILLMAIGALGVLGVGQIVWKKDQLQRIADLTAQAAAGDIADASTGFQAAIDYATQNGYDPGTGDTLSVSCNVRGTDTLLAAGNCAQSVLVTINRNVTTSFLGTHTVSAKAEATVVPMIAGLVGTNLLAVNVPPTNPTLSPILDVVGAKLNITAVGYQGLLSANTQVDLVGLAVQLGVINQGDPLDLNALLNTQVTANQLLNAAFTVTGVSPADLGLTLPSGGAMANRLFNVGDIINAPTAGTISDGSIRLGDLGYISTLAAVAGVPAGTIKLSLGSTADVTIVEPPKLYFAIKRPDSGAVLGSGQTEQIHLHVKLAGLLDVDLISGGGQVDITDIQCRLPQSQTTVQANVTSVPLTVSLQALSIPTTTVSLSSSAQNGVTMVGYPNPVIKSTYNFEATQGISNLTDSLNTAVGGLLGSVLNIPLLGALNNVGTTVNDLLDLTGLGVNQVVVEENAQHCFDTAVLTR